MKDLSKHYQESNNCSVQTCHYSQGALDEKAEIKEKMKGLLMEEKLPDKNFGGGKHRENYHYNQAVRKQNKKISDIIKEL